MSKDEVVLSQLDYGLGYTNEQNEDRAELYLKPYNPTVMSVLHVYEATEDTVLFGAVGDLDNLGYYVSTRGRAAAENLVDLYNQIIRNVVSGWAYQQDDSLKNITFVPSGEEILVLGATTESANAEALLSELSDRTNHEARRQDILPIGNTGASFGCRVFGDTYDAAISDLTAKSKNGDDTATAKAYFETLGAIRTELGEALDAEKFKNRFSGNSSLSAEVLGVAFRRLVWAGMREYKDNTYARIASLAAAHECGGDAAGLDIEEIIQALFSCQPGLPEDKEFSVGILARIDQYRTERATE